MPWQNSPSNLSPDQRTRELACIFAAGVQRLRRRNMVAGQYETANDFSAGRREFSPDTVLSVTNPVNGRESQTPGARA